MISSVRPRRQGPGRAHHEQPVSTSDPFAGGAITCADNAAVDRDYRRDESPILVDLDGDGIHLSAPADGAHFDLTGFGLPQQFSWPSQGDAFLALDLIRTDVSTMALSYSATGHG
jgi:hypothetical protein